MNNSADATNLFDLASSYCDGTLSERGLERLETLLGDGEARRQFGMVMEQHAWLQQEFLGAEAVDELAALDLDEYPTPGRLAKWWLPVYDVIKQPMALGAIVSGLFITIILLSLALWRVPEWRPGATVAQQPSTDFVARIVNTSQASFDATSDGNFHNRDLFDDDTIVLHSGLVVVEYDTGARVVLEGPATYHVQGANGGDLRHGGLVARVDTKASQGFFVDVPGARIVDLGTEFGVEVAAEGASEVAVLDGEVEVLTDGGAIGPPQRVRLAAGEGASIEAGGGNIVRQPTADDKRLLAMRHRLSILDGAKVTPAVLSIPADMAIYHDFGGQPSPGHITTQRSLDETIRLVDHADGAETGIELTINGATGVSHLGEGATRPPAAGTAAAHLFDDSGLDLHSGTVNVGGNNPSKSMTLTLSGLEPGRRYDLALYGDRAAPADGVERFTLLGAVAATNRSSIGVVDRFTTDMETRPNTASGHIVRWTDVAVGENGTLAVRIDADVSAPLNIAYLSALRLARQEAGPRDAATGSRNTPSGQSHELDE